MNRMLLLACTLVIFVSFTSARTNILFYGNSFTRYNNVTGTVANIAAAAGFPKPHTAGRIVDGNTLNQHLGAMQSAGSNSVIYTSIPANQHWHFVVMQEYSTKPTSIGDPPGFRADALALQSLVRARSSNVIATLLETWARPDLCPPYGSSFPSLTEMQSQLRTNYWLAYTGIATNSGGAATRFAPVGDGFEKAGFDLGLYAADKYHAGPRGSLLEAMIIYAAIFNDTVSDIPPGTLATVLAQAGVTQADWDYAAPLADLTVFGTIDPFYTYTIDVDCGSPAYLTTNTGWNNATNHLAGATLSNLFTSAGMTSALSLTLGSGFSGIDGEGIATSVLFPASAQRDSFVLPGGATGTLVFSGLNDYDRCDVRVFGSRRVTLPDLRLCAQAGAAAMLDTRNNAAQLLTLAEVPIASNGEAIIHLTRVGTNADDTATLSALELIESAGTYTYEYSLLFDFGDASTPTPGSWNNAVNPFPAQINNCITTNGMTTSISMVMSNWYAGSNQSGVSTGAFEYAGSATRDNAFIARESWGAGATGTSFVYLTGLDNNKAYTFTFFGSRLGATDVREAEYTLFGASTLSVYLNASDNYSQRVTTPQLMPNNGQIVLRVSPGPNNNNSDKFGYLGVMDVRCYALSGPPPRVVQCDLGVPEHLTPGAWNNLTNMETGVVCASLQDTNGTPTSFELWCSNGFARAEAAGVVTSVWYPASAQRDGFVLDATDTNAVLVLRGLSPTNSYTLRLFGSRAYATPDRRLQLIAGGQVLTLDTANNSAQTVLATNLVPNSGSLTVKVYAPGHALDDFACLNVVRLGVTVPEPARTLLLMLMAACHRRAVRTL